MSFHEVRLPDDIERGADIGPGFNTQIASLSSGFEQRNGNWSRARITADVGYGIQSEADYQEIVKFFYARQGRLFGFRFKDWSDFKAVGEVIGTGDDAQTKFQLVKTYSDSGNSYERPIQKPVSGSVTVYEDGVEQANVTVDTTTGVVTFDTAPGAGVEITADFEFDVPVRFDIDRISVQVEWLKAGSVPNIPLVEILQPLASLE